MTKPLAGQSFAGFIHDLGLKKGEIQVKSLVLGQGVPQQPEHSAATRALLVGSMMIVQLKLKEGKNPKVLLGTCGSAA